MSEFDNETINRLAGRIRNDDRQAFDALFRLLYPSLVYFFMRYVRDRDAACDMVQDTFVALWLKRSGIDPDQALRSYLYTAVRNRSLNWLQHSANKNESFHDRPSIDLVSDSRADTVVASNIDENNTISDLSRNWIAELPERRQEAFELSRFSNPDRDTLPAFIQTDLTLVWQPSLPAADLEFRAGLVNLMNRKNVLEKYLVPVYQNDVRTGYKEEYRTMPGIYPVFSISIKL